MLLSAPLVARLGLNADLTALLPASAQSVHDLHTAVRRFGAPQAFALLVRSEDQAAMHRFTRRLADALTSLREQGVRAVDWNVGEYQDFVRAHRHLYAPLDKLTELRDALDRRYRFELSQANPLAVWLDDPPGDELSRLLTEFEERGRAAAGTTLTDRYPDGFFQHPDGKSVVVFLRTDIAGGEHARMNRLMEATRALVDSLDPKSYAPDLRVDLGGGILEMNEEQEALARAAVVATLFTVVLVIAVAFVFFRRPRALVILPLGMLPALMLTFAAAKLGVDYLNASSAFLVTVVIGNGVNAHIIWLARYLEIRRGGADPESALAEAHRSTWAATLSAASAAAIAYASLTMTDFRAFRDFGIIGGIGLMLSWAAAMLFTPVLALLWDRARPLSRLEAGRKAAAPLYGRWLAKVALAAPRWVVATTALLTLVASGLVAVWFARDPLEYDFRNMQSQRPEGPLQRVNKRIGDSVTQTKMGSAISVITQGPGDVPGVIEAFTRRIEREPNVVKGARHIDNLLPTDQHEKIPLLQEIRRLGLSLRRFADADTRAEIDRELPPAEFEAVAAEDLPETAVRPFVELDGTRGSVVYVEAHHTRNQADGRFLIEWTDFARSGRNRDGTEVAVTGTAPIVADLVTAIVRDGPRAVGLSFVATLALLALTFRRGWARGMTLTFHLVGILWMLGVMAAIGMRLNFLNFLALPITFGNGVDYGVNVMRRVLDERGGAGAAEAVATAIAQTGGAVTLCSLTTIIGYLAFYASPNQAVNSFGLAMSISEVTCVAAAVIGLPAAMVAFGVASAPATGRSGARSGGGPRG